MEWVTTTGRTVEEAKEAALDELGVDDADAEFEVLEEPRAGLFGRQRGEARVRGRVRPTAPRPKVERRTRGKRKSEPGSNTRSTPPEGADLATSDAASDERATPPPRRKRTRGARDATGADVASGPTKAPATTTNGGAIVPEDELSLAEQGRIAEQFVVGLLEHFGAAAQTSLITHEDELLEVQVAGPDLGLLIGPKGQTLQALQELTRTVVQRRSVARTGRIVVDVAGYRARRREALERFARQVADDVIATGSQRGLEPMNAADRKVVHDTVNELAGVRTLSEGEEPTRRVVIIPDPTAPGGAEALVGADAAGDTDTEVAPAEG
ncbi:MAG: RNA-binding cell elongation regulator Jag/EloR [Acidimicrobiales bacterium]